MKTSVIICAAGKGERAGLGVNKVLAPYNGQPVIYTVCEKFFGVADEIVIACQMNDLKEIMQVCSQFQPVVVAGGKTRFDSVYNALGEVSGEIVLIHDGARPFVDVQTVKHCIENVTLHRSAICAVPVTDTIAVCENGEIVNVPKRAGIYRLQTPQGFYTADIKRAYGLAKKDGGSFSDDSSVYLKYIGKPHLFEGSESNEKLTFKSQFDRQYPLINAKNGSFLTGFGSDVHAFGSKQKYITLCGVKIESETGLIAHSDGDVAAHAIMDALLSAAGLKDIGHYFPDTDDRYLNADSMHLLAKVVALIRENGLQVANLSVAINAEHPRLAPHIDAMKNNLAKACCVGPQHIGISAGTGEGLGFVGNGLGVHATCSALLRHMEDGNGKD